jgi:hypothetical protein
MYECRKGDKAMRRGGERGGDRGPSLGVQSKTNTSLDSRQQATYKIRQTKDNQQRTADSDKQKEADRKEPYTQKCRKGNEEI